MGEDNNVLGWIGGLLDSAGDVWSSYIDQQTAEENNKTTATVASMQKYISDNKLMSTLIISGVALVIGLFFTMTWNKKRK